MIVACAALAIATLARIFAVSMGFDSFTAFIVFLVVLAIQVIVYLSIHVVLQNLMLPWIGNGLAKIPYFRMKIEQRQALPVVIEPQIEEEEAEIDTPESDVSLEDIANYCDVFYIGGTKVGALFGEAVVITPTVKIKHFFTIMKQHGALMAKGRLLGIQFETLFTDDL